jgi:hypothetical protein
VIFDDLVRNIHKNHFLLSITTCNYSVCKSDRLLAGVNRTGVMIAAYRVLIEGVSNDDAIKEMGRYRGLWFKADAEYIRGLSPKRRNEIRDKVMMWIPKLKMDAQVVCTNGICAVSDH